MSNYQAIRDNVRPGDILLSRDTNSPISQVIAGVTRAHWSHTFMALEDGKILESSWDGVVINQLEHYLDGQNDVGLFRVKPDLTEKQKEKLIKEARKLLGIHYGFWQLVWQFILRICGKSEDPDYALDVDSGMICTEVVATAYAKIGIELKPLPPSQMEPVDFDDSPITVRIV